MKVHVLQLKSINSKMSRKSEFSWLIDDSNTDPGSYKLTIRTKRKRTLHTNDMKNARYTKRTHERNETNYTENANERTNDT
jgi:hypothetical protein